MIKQKRLFMMIIFILSISIIFQLTGCKSVTMSADYLFFGDYKSLFDHADLIITGEVVKVNKAEKIDIRSDRTKPIGEEDKFLYTVSEVKVIDVIKGDVKVGDIVQVKQLGDKNGRAEEFLLKNDGYFKKNNQYVLFLAVYKNPESPSDTLNPEQGQINIVDGVTKVNEINPLFKSGIPIDQFVAELKTKVNSYKELSVIK